MSSNKENNSPNPSQLRTSEKKKTPLKYHLRVGQREGTNQTSRNVFKDLGDAKTASLRNTTNDVRTIRRFNKPADTLPTTRSVSVVPVDRRSRSQRFIDYALDIAEQQHLLDHPLPPRRLTLRPHMFGQKPVARSQPPTTGSDNPPSAELMTAQDRITNVLAQRAKHTTPTTVSVVEREASLQPPPLSSLQQDILQRPHPFFTRPAFRELPHVNPLSSPYIPLASSSPKHDKVDRLFSAFAQLNDLSPRERAFLLATIRNIDENEKVPMNLEGAMANNDTTAEATIRKTAKADTGVDQPVLSPLRNEKDSRRKFPSSKPSWRNTDTADFSHGSESKEHVPQQPKATAATIARAKPVSVSSTASKLNPQCPEFRSIPSIASTVAKNVPASTAIYSGESSEKLPDKAQQVVPPSGNVEIVVPFLQPPHSALQTADHGRLEQVRRALLENLFQQKALEQQMQKELQDIVPSQPVKPKPVVLDDEIDHGREVKISSLWYAKKLLAAFQTQYPLTGSRAVPNSPKPPPLLPRALRDHQNQQPVAQQLGTSPLTSTEAANYVEAARIQQKLEITLLRKKERQAAQKKGEAIHATQKHPSDILHLGGMPVTAHATNRAPQHHNETSPQRIMWPLQPYVAHDAAMQYAYPVSSLSALEAMTTIDDSNMASSPSY